MLTNHLSGGGRHDQEKNQRLPSHLHHHRRRRRRVVSWRAFNTSGMMMTRRGEMKLIETGLFVSRPGALSISPTPNPICPTLESGVDEIVESEMPFESLALFWVD